VSGNRVELGAVKFSVGILVRNENNTFYQLTEKSYLSLSLRINLTFRDFTMKVFFVIKPRLISRKIFWERKPFS